MVADIRTLPHDAELPYGTGVFLHSRMAVLLSIQSELAFAGQCRRLDVAMPDARRLTIACDVDEGRPLVPDPVVKGVAIEVALRRDAPDPSATAAARAATTSPAPPLRRGDLRWVDQLPAPRRKPAP